MNKVGDKWSLKFGQKQIMDHPSSDSRVYIEGCYGEEASTFTQALKAIDVGVKHGGYFQLVTVIAICGTKFKGTYMQLKKIVEQINEDGLITEKVSKPKKVATRGFWARIFCTHSYKLIQNFTVPSEFDVIVESGKIPNTHNSQQRKIVSDYKCENCGKLKRLTA